jgi:predicted transcriptional regulator
VPKEDIVLTDSKVKVEIQRGGTKVTLTVEGDDSPIADDVLSSLLGVLRPALNSSTTESNELTMNSSDGLLTYEEMTTKDRVKHLVRNFLKHSWFDSKEILELYRHYLDTEVPPSTISTYLARLTKEGILQRRGTRINLQYRLRPNQLTKIPEIPVNRVNTPISTISEEN